MMNLPKIKNKNIHGVDFLFTESPIDGYKNFAFVRNPYARLYSLWVNKVASGHLIEDGFINGLDNNVFCDLTHIIYSGMEFKDFVYAILDPDVPLDPHWAPQYTQFPDGCICFKICDHNELLTTLFPVENESINKSWQDAYDKELRGFVYSYYKKSFEMFGYPKYEFTSILIDCDGVLTDGKLTIDRNGEKQFKQFHTRDVRAIRELIFNGYEVVIVSADDWPGIYHFADKVGADVYISRDKNDLPFKSYAAVGDDAWDVQMLQKAKMAFCPADADPSTLTVPGIQRLVTKGGCGVIAEIARELLK